MTENIYGPGGVGAALSKYLKQIPDTNETEDIATPTKRYRDTYTKTLVSDDVQSTHISAQVIENNQILTDDLRALYRVHFPSGQVTIGDNLTQSTATHAVALGAGCFNATAHTVKLGCNEVSDISPTASNCDLGSSTPFKRLKLSEGVQANFVGNANTVGAPTSLALGDDANNIIPNSVLLGNPTCSVIYPNNDTVCDLGRSVNKFKDVWMLGNIVGVDHIVPTSQSISLGQGANGYVDGIAIGTGSTAQSGGVAVGTDTIAEVSGFAFGAGAQAAASGIAIGRLAVATGGTVVIGSECKSLATEAHVLGGYGLENSEVRSLLIGGYPGGPLLNIRSNGDLVTDLGTPTNRFASIYVNHVATPGARFSLDTPLTLGTGASQDLLTAPTADSTTEFPAGTTAAGDRFSLLMSGNLDTSAVASGTITLGTSEEGAFITHTFNVLAAVTQREFSCAIDCVITSSGLHTSSTFSLWDNDTPTSISHSKYYNETTWDGGIIHTLTLTYSTGDIDTFRPKQIFFRRL